MARLGHRIGFKFKFRHGAKLVGSGDGYAIREHKLLQQHTQSSSDTPRPLALRLSVALLFRMNVCTSVSIIATADATSLISCTSLLGLYLTLRLPSTCFALLPFHIPCLLAITKGSYCSHQHDNIMVYITRSAVYMQILHEFQAQVIPGNRSASHRNG